MDQVADIKARLSIAEVVGKYVTLKPAGRNFKGLCPFHQDHSPSFLVSNEKGIGWCFVCQSGGDIFSFIQKIENVDFPEALKILADMAGVTLEKSSSDKGFVKKEKKLRLMELLEEAQNFFRQSLLKAKGVQEKIAERELTPEILEKFGLGYAPDDFHGLENALLKLEFSRAEMLEAGVLASKDAAGKETYDRFRGRITFPIWDAHGQLRGFGGRIFGTGEPKYLNSPETILYQKSTILYGLNFAKEAIKKQDFCLVTEGYFDVIACHHAGITNTVATSGTALTAGHIKLLQRFSKNIVFAFDADIAGQEATKRAIMLALEAEANAFVMTIPLGKDPDEALRQNPAEFHEALAARQPVMEFLFEQTLRGKNLEDIAEKRSALEILLPFLAAFSAELERNHYAKKLAERLRINVAIIQKELQDFKKAHDRGKIAVLPVEEPLLKTKISALSYLMGMLAAYPELFGFAKETLFIDLAPRGIEKTIYNAWQGEYSAAALLQPEKVLPELSAAEQEALKLWSLYAEEKTHHLAPLQKKELLRKVIQTLNMNFIKQELETLNIELKQAAYGSTEQQELTKKIMDFTRLLRHI